MSAREKDLSHLKTYTEEIDKELTLILQSLQWNREHLLQGKPLVKCKYDTGHRIPEEIKGKHEEECSLNKQGYSKNDALLPDAVDNSTTLVKLSNKDICNIINMAAASDPHLQRGVGCEGPQPLTLERLQTTYSADERRAIHNAVVATVPACHDLSDLTLPSSNEPSSSREPKSRLEILTELRNMKRRRIKYRVACKSRNYSGVLRDVIKSQMELYTGVKSEPISIKPEPEMPAPMNIKQEYSPRPDDDEYTNYEEDTYTNREVKRERDVTEERVSVKRESAERYDRRNRDREYSKDKYRRHKERYRNGKSRDGDRKRHNEEYRQERRHNEEHRQERRYYEEHRQERRHNREYRQEKDRGCDTSKDRRKKERYDIRDKDKSNGSHSYSEVKVKEEKRRRHYDYDSCDDYDERRRR